MPNTGQPLFICGLPRAGTSFLFAILSRHEAFANPRFEDKELRYFQNLIGKRPWGLCEAVSQTAYEGIDPLVLPYLLRALNDRLAVLRGGPQGHYLNGNPRDIFCSGFILDAIPEAKFIISIRSPFTNVWSALNYPSHEWGQKTPEGFFKEEHVRNVASHWSKVAQYILENRLHRHPSFFILEQEKLAAGKPSLHVQLEKFIGVPGIAALLDSNSGLVIHSSFIENKDGLKDRQFDTPEQRATFFRRNYAGFAEEERYTAIIEEVCGNWLRQLNERDILLP